MADWAERKHFGTYINRLRRGRGLQLEQVCEGLCTKQLLSYCERGERAAPKLLQDALLERLGVGAEDYEHYLGYVEYDHWVARQRILYYITYEEMEQALQLLEQYRITYVSPPRGRWNISDRLERQFYLSMLAQIRRYEGADRADLHAIFEEAVRLTMPRLWERPLEQYVFSLKELNLILEAEQCREDGGCEWHYRELLAYIEATGLDGVAKAKIYPKVVYFLCRCLIEETGAGRWKELLTLCSYAVECLRDNSRMYYLWEILEMREWILDCAEDGLCRMEPGRVQSMEAMKRENAEWKGALESVYAEFGVRKENFSYAYLYMEKGVACINDVIRIRRGMLGMSRRELCEGICDIKTLRRLENRKTVSQREIVEALFARLGLPRELSRTELVTEDPEAMELMRQLRVCINDRRTEDAEKICAKIKELVSLEIRCNQQTLLRKEINLQEEQGILDAKFYYSAMRNTLELTLPFKDFLREGEKYLTYEEQSCIQNMMQRMDRDSEEFTLCMKYLEELYCPFEKNGLIGTVNNIYEFIMGYIGSERGNEGNFEKANQYNDTIINECLRFRRLNSIPDALYDRWWNDLERKRRELRSDKLFDTRTELNRCILFSRLDKRKYYELFYQKMRLRQIDEEE